MARAIPDLTAGADLPAGFPPPWPVPGHRGPAGPGCAPRRARGAAPCLRGAIGGPGGGVLRGPRLPRRVPVRVRYGSPTCLDLSGPQSRDNQAIADRVGALVAALLPEAYRGH